MPTPPIIPCSITKQGLQSHLTALVARWDAMRLRVLQGFSTLIEIKAHWCELPGSDPANCCTRAGTALTDAQFWLASGDAHVTGNPPSRGVSQLIQELIDAIDCSAYPTVIDLAIQQSLVALNYFEFWLNARDQELGTMEALWSQIHQQCLVIVPVDPPVDPLDDPQ